jgi:hypothetical protein
MQKLTFFLSIFLITQTSVFAQNSNTVVYKNPVLDALENRPAALIEYANKGEESTPPTEKAVTPVKVVEKKAASVIHAGNKTVTGDIVTKQGFRVLLYSGTDKAYAIKIKTEFNRKYMSMRSYFDYNAPNYKIKVGDFDDKKVALKFAKQMQSIVPTATVVPDIVTIKHIVVQTN